MGGEIPAAPSLPRGDPAELEVLNRGLALHPDTLEHGLGEPMDLAAMVDSLIAINECRDPAREGLVAARART